MFLNKTKDMQRVLIIGPRFHYFNESVERAFSALGYETQVLAYDNPVHPYTCANKIRYKFASSEGKLRLKRQSQALFHLEAEAAFEAYEPDLVFVMNGDMLLPDTLLHWRGQMEDDPCPPEHPAKVALWLFDSMSHIPLCDEVVPVVDEVFCYEQTDIPLIRERFSVEAHFLPQAVDPDLYHPLEVHQSPLDIVFAGDLVHSQRRRELIQTVVAHYPDLRIKVWGEYKPWYKGFWRWLTRERRDVYRNCNASGEQLNVDYNRARVVLNVHHEQQQDGANPKVYEISASGAYQVCDANPYIEQLFAHGEVGLYHNMDELFALIDDALSHDKRAEAESARQIILSDHTFIHRIQQCLNVLT